MPVDSWDLPKARRRVLQEEVKDTQELSDHRVDL